MKIKANYQSKIGYRLPTEAEWEYACRAGTVTRFLFGDSHELIGRYASCSSMSPVPVGSLLPNAFGLFDTHGNVFEWCQDAPETEVAVDVGMGEIVDAKVDRCNRGGGFFSRPLRAWSATRYKDIPVLRNDANGFRLVRSRPQTEGSSAASGTSAEGSISHSCGPRFAPRGGGRVSSRWAFVCRPPGRRPASVGIFHPGMAHAAPSNVGKINRVSLRGLQIGDKASAVDR